MPQQPLSRWMLLVVLVLLGARLAAPAPVLAAGIVGDGSAGSCTQAALAAAVVGGGTVTFNCGGAAVINITATLTFTTTTTLDGGSEITFDGAGARRFINHTAGTLTLRNMTIRNFRASGVGTASNGGAVRSYYQGQVPTLVVENVRFENNVANQTADFPGGAQYDYGGGAIFTQGGFLTITNSVFVGNNALKSGGGAVHVLQSTVTITGSTFEGNGNSGSTGQGGALYIDGMGRGGRVTITGTTFRSNVGVVSGGAIYVHMYQGNNHFSVERSSFIGNTLNGGLGGAISGGNGRVTINRSLFSGNIATRPAASGGGGGASGGALAFAETADITIANSTFYNNQARYTGSGRNAWNANGGALYVVNNSVPYKVINSTFANNFAGWVGGAITGRNGRLTNTLFFNNSAANGGNGWNIDQTCSDTLTNGGGNMQFPGRTSPNDGNDSLCASGIRVANPNLQPLADNGGPTQTMALPLGSPAIDGGVNSVCAAAPIGSRDQRGVWRPYNGNNDLVVACDIGAFEFNTPLPPVVPTLTAPRHNTPVSAGSVLFTWGAPHASEYDFQLTRANFSSPLIDLTLSSPSYRVSFLPAGVYYWHVRARSPLGTTNWSATFTLRLTSASTAVPQHRYATTGSPTLTWNRISWATGYQVQLSTSSTFATAVFTSPGSGGGVLDASTLSVEPTPELQPGIYYWRVRARRADGLTWGGWSATETLLIGGS